MGRYVTETFDPDELELPNDTDFELEGIDEEYGEYQEYEAYMPDLIGEMRPVSESAKAACEKAERELGRLRDRRAGEAAAGLLLCVEAVATSRVENYRVSCESMLEFDAARKTGARVSGHVDERAALDAARALRDFVARSAEPLTITDVCAANEAVSGTSRRADLCGTLREGPVFIGESLFDASYVAPPADEVEDYLDDLLRYVNAADAGESPVVRAAIAQVQFFDIHPFSDGNGRTGRALAQRMLAREGLTSGLVVPFTAYVASRESAYIDAIRTTQMGGGPIDPSEFVTFFARACEAGARQAMGLVDAVERALADWAEALSGADDMAPRAAEAFAATPVMTEALLSSRLGCDVAGALVQLEGAGVVTRGRSSLIGVDVCQASRILDALAACETC